MKEQSMPFSVENNVLLSCSYGAMHKKNLIFTLMHMLQEDHNYRTKKFMVQTTKKVGCPAKLTIKRITL